MDKVDHPVVRYLGGSGDSLLGFQLAGLTLLLDQVSKWLVLQVLKLSPEGCLEYQRAAPLDQMGLYNTCKHIEVSSFFDVTMVWNKGVSFGLLGADSSLGRFLLVGFSLLVAGVLLAGLLGYGPLAVKRRIQVIGFGLIIGGALGNAVDRAFFGAVVDFLNFSDIMFPWVFNIADIAVNLGVVAILLDIAFFDRDSEKTKQ
jgi:signal peptidase II